MIHPVDHVSLVLLDGLHDDAVPLLVNPLDLLEILLLYTWSVGRWGDFPEIYYPVIIFRYRPGAPFAGNGVEIIREVNPLGVFPFVGDSFRQRRRQKQACK